MAFLLPDKNNLNNHAYAYLSITKQIDREIISKFIADKNLYEDKRYNCVFVGYDYDGVARFGTVQGTNTSRVFRADIRESNNELGLFLNNGSEDLIVTDTVINGMSLMSIMKEKGKNLDDYSYLMLSGTDNSFEAIKYHLSHNENIKKIVISFDNNSKNVANHLNSELKGMGFGGSIIEYFPKNKNFNEDLISQNKFLKEARGTDGRFREDHERTSRGDGRNRELDKETGTKLPTLGQIRIPDIDTHSGVGQGEIPRAINTREPVREDTRETRTGTNDFQDDSRSTGEARGGRGDRGLHEESGSTPENLLGSGQHSNEGDRVKADVNFKAELNPDNYGGAKTKYQNNVVAIRLLKDIEQQSRLASPQEQITLSKYTGWGGIPQAFDENNQQWNREYIELKSLLTESEYEMARASTPNAHYTQPIVIKAMYEGLKQFGFTTGAILEPAMGIGNFFANIPDAMDNSALYGVELDNLSGRISKQLFPNADIQIKGFEKTDYPDNYFDVAIGNIPFGNYKVNDSGYNKHNFLIHDYFFAKTLDKVKPGGVVAFVTSKGTLDKANTSTRRYLAQKAELLGAVRLPNTAFKGIANTEVTTDIIFLRKREREIVCEPNWLHLGLTADNVPVNQYYLDNPDMMLGRMVFDSSMYGNEKLTALVADENFDLEVSLNKAVTSIVAEVIDTNLTNDETSEISAIPTIPADPNVKNFTYTVVNGDLYYRINSIMKQSEYTGKKLEKAKLLTQIRKAVREIINIQTRHNYSSDDLQTAQAELNAVYDTFVLDYGYLNHKDNQKVLEEDIDNPLLLSIEKKAEEENEYEKADIFRKATIKPKENYKVETAEDALVVSLNQYSRVNIAYMASLYNTTEESIIKELEGRIFMNPALHNPNEPFEGYETAEEYLSGDVKAKLAYAKSVDSEIFGANVQALEQVQPEDLKIYDIGYKLGSNWIPIDMYHEFMYEILETPTYFSKKDDKDSVNIVYNEFSTAYTIYNKGNDTGNLLANTKYGTSRRNAYQIIEDTLNFKASNVYDLVTDYEGKEKRVLNPKETQVARAKQELIKNEFINWLSSKEERISTIETIYNERFNVYVPRKYDGNNLIVPSMSENLELRQHQKDAAMRILLGGNTLLAHEVGSGKTFTMATGAILLKQAGIAKKPLFVVPNHLIQQWGSEFLSLYPTANMLVPSAKDFEKKNRQRFVSKIATGDYDAVVLSFTQFEKIPMSPEYIQNQIEKEIFEISDAIKTIKQQKGERMSVKQYEVQKKVLEERLSKMVNEDKKDNVLHFEELGVDYIFVDEAHNYKNCFVHTKMTNVAGVANTNAQKSFDMLLKTRYLTEKNNGRGVVFATGTPITNSISETYVMQRYLQEGTLRKSNINHFDKWASVFGEITTSLELAPTGRSYRMKTRFSKFYNLPELLKMFSQCADMKSIDELGIKRPDIEGGKAETIVVKPSDFVLDKMKELEARCDIIKSGSIDASIDNMLKITMEGKGVAIDPRLVDLDAPVNKESKIYACCNQVADMYNKSKEDKALQLVFLDYGIQLYEVIKKELVEQGVNEKEIAFISDAKNDKQKEELFEKCRNGRVRVLIGSTTKMGAGTNVQARMIALHHIDCPWRPADIEQRNGRIRRQGNRYDKVHIFQYVTEGTFDSYLWQIQEKKQVFISQIMKNDTSIRNYEDLDQAALECSEVKALCCGDPRIKEKADIDNAIQRLQIEKNSYFREQEKLKDIVKNTPQQLNLNACNMLNIQKDLQQLQLGNRENFEIVIQGKTYVERVDAAEVFGRYVNNLPFGKSQKIGSYKGLDLILSKGFESKLTVAGEYKLDVELGGSDLGNITRIENIITHYVPRLDMLTTRSEKLEKQLENAMKEVGKPFIKEAELSEKLQKQAELVFELELGKTVDIIIDDTAEEKSKPIENKSLTIEIKAPMIEIETQEIKCIAEKIVEAKQKAAEQTSIASKIIEPTR